MKRILISVEGQTEETFVTEVLSPYLADFAVYLKSVILTTKRLPQGTKMKGGILSYKQVKREIRILLQDTRTSLVTTMYDFYGLPHDFPGYDTMPAHNCFERIKHVETEFEKEIQNRRFTPYLQLHEFETFLFVSPTVPAEVLFSGQNLCEKIQKIRDRYETPEEINEGLETAPSKRIQKLYPEYNKPLYGTLVAGTLGVEALKLNCPHFNAWLTRLENM